MKINLKSLLLLCLVSVCALFIVACGGGDDEAADIQENEELSYTNCKLQQLTLPEEERDEDACGEEPDGLKDSTSEFLAELDIFVNCLMTQGELPENPTTEVVEVNQTVVNQSNTSLNYTVLVNQTVTQPGKNLSNCGPRPTLEEDADAGLDQDGYNQYVDCIRDEAEKPVADQDYEQCEAPAPPEGNAATVNQGGIGDGHDGGGETGIGGTPGGDPNGGSGTTPGADNGNT